MPSTPLDEAISWRRRLAREGRAVAFTNGCFDLLHPGHASLLRQARLAADALVVGLNGDASVTRLKGEGRPLVPAEERAELLEAMEAVDRVVVFDEDTPRELILVLEPDVLVKGADWAPDRIVGAAEVASWGGRVLRVPLLKGASTSATIARIRQDGGP